jgi:hypothetical protein
MTGGRHRFVASVLPGASRPHLQPRVVDLHIRQPSSSPERHRRSSARGNRKLQAAGCRHPPSSSIQAAPCVSNAGEDIHEIPLVLLSCFLIASLSLGPRNHSIPTSQEPLSTRFAASQRTKHELEKEEGLSTFSVGSLEDLVMNRLFLVSWQIYRKPPRKIPPFTHKPHPSLL